MPVGTDRLCTSFSLICRMASTSPFCSAIWDQHFQVIGGTGFSLFTGHLSAQQPLDQDDVAGSADCFGKAAVFILGIGKMDIEGNYSGSVIDEPIDQLGMDIPGPFERIFGITEALGRFLVDINDDDAAGRLHLAAQPEQQSQPQILLEADTERRGQQHNTGQGQEESENQGRRCLLHDADITLFRR